MATTGFRINDASNSDLSTIFNPRGSATPATNTGFIAIDGSDISLWFQPYSNLQAVTTNYKISNGTDLNSVFQKLNIINYTATGTFTTTSGTIRSVSYNRILRFTGSGTFTLNSGIATINCLVVGGGGRGGLAATGNDFCEGGAGGGGAVVDSSFNPIVSTSYSINVGNGEQNSSISNTAITANRGINGAAATNQASGNGGASGNGNNGGLGQNGQGGCGGGAGGGGGTFVRGPGISFTINSTTTTYGVGGFGGSNAFPVAGGANTGDGGGGGRAPQGAGAAGGSGIIILYFNI